MLEEDSYHQLERDIDEIQRMLTSLVQRVRPLVIAKKLPVRETLEAD
jgi:hypothetical protein